MTSTTTAVMGPIIPSITGIVTTTNIIATRVLEFGDRLHTTQENKTEWKKFAKSYKTFAEGIIHYESAINLALSSESFLSDVEKQELKRLLTILENITTDTESKLPVLESRLEGERTPAGSASTNPTQGNEPQTRKLQRMNWWWKSKKAKTGALSHAERDDKTIKHLKDSLEKAEANLKEGMKLIKDSFGIFKVHFKDYNRGDNIYFDYQNGDKDGASHEAKLKHTVLNPSIIGSSSQHSSVPRTICVKGQGGMGKTTVLKDICTDKDVREKFLDGIHFMTIGEGADDNQIITETSKCLSNAGFSAIGAKVKEEESVEEAALMVSKIFRGKQLLLVVDDWHPKHERYLKHIRTMLHESMKGVLLISSRYKHISTRCNEVLYFKELEPTGEKSRKILLKHMKNESLDEKEMQVPINRILGACGGIKLCLAIAGSSILLLGNNSGIKKYAEDLERTSEEVVTKEGGEELRVFLDVLVTSLGYCNNELLRLRCKDMKGRRTGPIEARELFKGFCVFEKQRGVPIEAISRLWNIDRRNSIYIIRSLSSYHVLSVDENERFVEIHDKVMDVARYLAEEKEEDGIRKYHVKILRGHLLLLGCSSMEEEEQRRDGTEKFREISHTEKDWDLFSFPQRWELGEEEEYFVGNVCRHLEEGGRIEELWKLVTNVCWLLRRRKTGGWVGFASDFNRLRRLSEGGKAQGKMVELLNDKEKVGMDLLMNHIRDGWMEVKDDAQMIGFEVFARVLKEDRRYKVVQRYLKSIEEEGPRPWLKPLAPGLGRIDGRQIGKMSTRNAIEKGSCVSADGRFVVCQSDEGFEVIDTETRERWWIKAKEGEFLTCTSVSSKPPLRVVCGSINGKVTVWDVENGEQVGQSLIGHEGRIDCIRINRDGNRVVSSGSEGSVRVWDVEKGKQVGEPITGRHGRVRCVGMSNNCNRVVFCEWSGSAWVWDVEKDEELGVSLSANGRFIWSVGMTDNGRRVVTGGRDGNILVWDVEKGEQVGKPLTANVGTVWCVGISDDGNRLISGELDRTIRVWNVEKGDQLGEPIAGLFWEVRCAGISGDGSQVVYGANDGIVCVLNVENGEEASEAPIGIYKTVGCIGMSNDGNRVLSVGNFDEVNLRIWNVENGKQIGEPLAGFNQPVEYIGMSGNGHRAAFFGYNKIVQVWDLENGEQVGETLNAHCWWTIGIGMSDDGNRLVSGDSDGHIHVWDVKDGVLVDKLVILRDEKVCCVGMSGDGRWVVDGKMNGSVQAFDIQRMLHVGISFRLYEDRESFNAFPFEEERVRNEYNSWLRNIRSFAYEEGLNEAPVCLKSLHQNTSSVLEKLGVSIPSDYIHCDCSECESGDKVAECLGENKGLTMWLKDDNYIYVKSPKVVKIGRVEKDWCMRDGRTVAMGMKNGRIMICRLQV